MGKRGPQKKPGKRKNGRLTNEAKLSAFNAEERDTLSVGVEARVRLYQVNEAEARDQRLGSFVGRLYMAKKITEPEYLAAQTYAGEREVYLRLEGFLPYPRAVDLNKVHGLPVGDEEAQAERTQRARKRFREAQGAVQKRQNELGAVYHLLGALDAFLVHETDMPHLFASFRHALDALAVHYGHRVKPVLTANREAV